MIHDLPDSPGARSEFRREVVAYAKLLAATLALGIIVGACCAVLGCGCATPPPVRPAQGSRLELDAAVGSFTVLDVSGFDAGEHEGY